MDEKKTAKETTKPGTDQSTEVKNTETSQKQPAAKKGTSKKSASGSTAAKKTSAAKAEPKKEGKAAAAKAEPKKEEKAAATKAEPKKEEKAAATKAEPKKEEKTAAAKAEPKKEEKAAAAKAEPKKEEKTPAAKTEPKKEEKAAAAKAEPKKEEKAPVVKEETKPEENTEAAAAVDETKAEKTGEKAEEQVMAEQNTVQAEPEPLKQEVYTPPLPTPRRSVAFIGSECYPFVKTGGLADVMYALPKALIAQNCDVKVIIPRYKCIPWEYQEKMVYKGSFDMNLCIDGRSFYVGIMEYVWDGVVYDFIDNEEFFGYGNPYTNLVEDIPKFCYFGKAALAALNYMNWIPDVIHCHDWQAGLVPIYLRTMFADTPIGRAKVMMTIHNLRFQGVYNIPTIRYWSGLPDYVFNKDIMTQEWTEANMLKGGLTYSNMITTVSGTYAGEIQSPYYGENLDAHLRYHSGKLRGIVNGIDYGMWNPATDQMLAAPYDITNVLDRKRKNKKALQEELGMWVDDGKFIIALISRLTNQKGLDLVNWILPQLIDGNTQVVVLGSGDAQYENSFRHYENAYKGAVCSNIMYDEGRAHKIYAGADALLVPSQFEPCGLTQLIAMHYGTIPIVRETGGLKDTVQPYNQYSNDGNGFTFDRYDAGLLLDAINRAKTLFFTNRWCWDEMVQRDMAKDVSWENSARHYRGLYMELTQY